MTAYLPPDAAALAAGIKPATLRQWVRRNKITRYGSGRRALYRLDELAAVTRRNPRKWT